MFVLNCGDLSYLHSLFLQNVLGYLTDNIIWMYIYRWNGLVWLLERVPNCSLLFPRDHMDSKMCIATALKNVKAKLYKTCLRTASSGVSKCIISAFNKSNCSADKQPNTKTFNFIQQMNKILLQFFNFFPNNVIHGSKVCDEFSKVGRSSKIVRILSKIFDTRLMEQIMSSLFFLSQKCLIPVTAVFQHY